MSSQFLLQYLDCYRELKGDYGMTFVPLIDNSYNYLAYSTSIIWDSPLLQYVSDILKLKLHKVSSTNQYNVFELVIPYDECDLIFNKILETGRTIVILHYNCDNNNFEIDEVIDPAQYESEDDDIIDKIKDWFTNLIKPNTSSPSFPYCYDCNKRIFDDCEDHICSDIESDDSMWSDNPHHSDSEIIKQDEIISHPDIVETIVEPIVAPVVAPVVTPIVAPIVAPVVEPVDNKKNADNNDDFIIIDTLKCGDDYVVL